MQTEIVPTKTPGGRVLRRIVIGFAVVWLALCLSASALGVGFLIGRSSGAVSGDTMAPFLQAWDLIHSKYVDQPVDDTKLIQGAINGMMQSLGDEHSTYMSPATYESATASLEGYEGIGAEVDVTGKYLKIVDPFPGSPAEKAGIKAGDEIIAVDGVDLTGVDPAAAREKLLGPAGTHVKVTVQRPGGAQPLEFDIVRAKIDPPVVKSSMLDGNIGYVYLAIFSDTASAQLKTALQDLMAQHPKGLILDLRGNPGGLVTSAVDVASQFLPADKLLLVERYGNGQEIRSYTHGGGLATTIPLVVLVDGGTASAAEIVAGAIQDYERAFLVGMPTYGKGSVQEWIALMGNNGAVRITVARWYTPNGRQISKLGLTPNIESPVQEKDVLAGKDVQRDFAWDLLQ
jgi:carboxyl-terminal processing protease